MLQNLFKARNSTRKGNDVGELALEALANRLARSTADASTLAVIEGAARIIGNALATAEVAGADALTPGLREMIGREIVKTGECLFLKQGKALLPVASWDIRGDPDPAAWAYHVTINGPDTSQETHAKVMADQVLHFRVNCRPESPWQGVAGWQGAKATADTSAAAERSAGESAAVPSGSILPFPLSSGARNTDQVEQAQKMTETATKALDKSGLLVLPVPGDSGAGNLGTSRIGPEPAVAHVQLRNEAQLALAWACGVPPQLLHWQAQGNTMRECWRQLQHGTLEPLARIIEGELMAKGVDGVKFSFKALHASDLATRGRVLKQLVDAKMPLAEAREIAGL